VLMSATLFLRRHGGICGMVSRAEATLFFFLSQRRTYGPLRLCVRFLKVVRHFRYRGHTDASSIAPL